MDKKNQELLNRLPDAGKLSPEDFFDKLMELFADIGLYTDVVSRSVEAKAWDHTNQNDDEWTAFLRRYRRLLTRIVNELQLHTKVYAKIESDLYGEEEANSE